MTYEVDTPLTITGLIATVISFIFAGAALYNSHRRKQQQQSGQTQPQSPVQPSPAEMIRHYVQQQQAPQPPQTLKPAAPAVIPAPAQKPAPVMVPHGDPLPPIASSGSLFKKLGTHGLEEAAQEPDDRQYRWE